jgi:hypothetical protein
MYRKHTIVYNEALLVNERVAINKTRQELSLYTFFPPCRGHHVACAPWAVQKVQDSPRDLARSGLPATDTVLAPHPLDEAHRPQELKEGQSGPPRRVGLLATVDLPIDADALPDRGLQAGQRPRLLLEADVRAHDVSEGRWRLSEEELERLVRARPLSELEQCKGSGWKFHAKETSAGAGRSQHDDVIRTVARPQDVARAQPIEPPGGQHVGRDYHRQRDRCHNECRQQQQWRSQPNAEPLAPMHYSIIKMIKS